MAGKSTHYIVFLRAINVGNRRIAMTDLASAVRGINAVSQVSTYIASGNVLCASTLEPAALEAAIETAVDARFGWRSEAFARTRTELAELIAAEPFPATPVAAKQPGSAHMVVFLKRALSASEAGALEAHSTDVDTLVVRGREVHWYRKGSSLSSKLKPAHWKAIGDQPMTNRNRTMLVKLASRF